jgi:agmatinase
MDISEKNRIVSGRVFWAHEIHGRRDWMQKALGLLSHNVFITIDLDGFDPSVMPSTGTPEPGGLLWYETLEFLRLVIDNRNLVGFDVVELCPDRREKSSDFLAAKLVYKLIAYKFMSSPYKYI